ncbi:DEAD-box ATP-dependent RNA helicase 31 [Linum grandiflorum]
MGFRRDLDKIIAALPKQRQTLLFSATVSEQVRQMSHVALKSDHVFVNTVEEGSEQTHARVRQTHMVASMDKHFPIVYALLRDHIADDSDYKVLVFCTTARLTGLVSEYLGKLKLNVQVIHSRKSQSNRTRVSDLFRKSKGMILVTSDVSARGVDYPDVTLVIQLGLPASREQYIHRLGRTGRKGKEGQGILLLAQWEQFFLFRVKDLPITEAQVPSIDLQTTNKVLSREISGLLFNCYSVLGFGCEATNKKVGDQVELAMSQVDKQHKEAAYQAWLGYYNSDKETRKDRKKLVEHANEFSRTMGLKEPPAIPKRILAKMSLNNVAGLRSS